MPDGGGFRMRWLAPLPFVASAFVFAAALVLLSRWWDAGTTLMLSFDGGAFAYILGIAPLVNQGPTRIRRYALANDANRGMLLLVTAVVFVVILVAVLGEFRPHLSAGEAGISAGTLAMMWLFANTVYAMHYTHMFYIRSADERRGLISFPGRTEPVFRDFAYFSFTLGMTFQTSDVEIRSTELRRLVLGHCLLAFIFNIGVLALAISSLEGSLR